MQLGIFVLFLLAVHGGRGEDEATEEKEESGPVEDIVYNIPKPVGYAYIAEHFDDLEAFKERWIVSEATKEGAEEAIAKYNGKWEVEAAEKNHLRGDLGLVLKDKAHHHAISAKLDRPFVFDHKTFVLQYEVHFQNGQDCGGAYMKLISDSTNHVDLKTFHDKTPYTIMFGPDKCGTEHKLHFIFRHRNPRNGTYEEKHWKRSTNVAKFDDIFKDKKPHLFTLIITPDNKFEVLVDKRSAHKGSLLEDFNPPVNPPAEIEDPDDSKPDDWDEREKIPDPNAQKPEDWDEDAPRQIPDPDASKPVGWLDDEPKLIPDESAEKPKDWDDDMDGEWEPPLVNNPKCADVGCGEWKPPLIDNPKYKGKWRPPLIDNPNYKGKWKPRKIPNPYYYEDLNPYRMTPVAAVGFELWSMSDGILFDNIIITDDPVIADQWAQDTWVLKKEVGDRETDGLFVRLIKYTNKYPWLWAIYIVVVGLPVVLFISFCCTTSSQDKAAAANAAKHKKTDEPVPDDPQVNADEPSAISEEEAASSESAEKMEGVNPQAEGGDVGSDKDEDDEDEDEEETNEANEEQEVEDAAENGAGDVKRSPRRRKPRRE